MSARGAVFGSDVTWPTGVRSAMAWGGLRATLAPSAGLRQVAAAGTGSPFPMPRSRLGSTGWHAPPASAGAGTRTEVIDQASRVLDGAVKSERAAIEWNSLPCNTANYKKTGDRVPPDGWDILRQHDAVFFGAVGSPDVPDTVTVQGL